MAFLTPQDMMAAQDPQAGDSRALQAALLRMDPETLRGMFQPVDAQLQGLEPYENPRQNPSALGSLLAGVGQMIASSKRSEALDKAQNNAQGLFRAVYGSDPGMDRQVMAAAIRGKPYSLGAGELQDPTAGLGG